METDQLLLRGNLIWNGLVRSLTNCEDEWFQVFDFLEASFSINFRLFFVVALYIWRNWYYFTFTFKHWVCLWKSIFEFIYFNFVKLLSQNKKGDFKIIILVKLSRILCSIHHGAWNQSKIKNPHHGRNQLHGKDPLGHDWSSETPRPSLLYQSRENILVPFY